MNSLETLFGTCMPQNAQEEPTYYWMQYTPELLLLGRELTDRETIDHSSHFSCKKGGIRSGKKEHDRGKDVLDLLRNRIQERRIRHLHKPNRLPKTSADGKHGIRVHKRHPDRPSGYPSQEFG
jgi:hypothetical protein